ncbi:MAG: hypothetical protein GC164_04780 [Phycisphaera sp.]|nr:hypothetical protein [Phycisphaera sp.]
MPKIPGIHHLHAIRAFEKAGFRILRQSKHIIMFDGNHRIVIPRANPIHAITMGSIVRDSGLTIEQFKSLLP